MILSSVTLVESLGAGGLEREWLGLTIGILELIRKFIWNFLVVDVE